MSKYILKDVTLKSGTANLRTIHMTLAYWGFMMMSLHLGLHFDAVSAKLRLRMNKIVKRSFVLLFGVASAYGIYAFKKRAIGDYLVMKVMFAFFDFDEPKIRFFADYTAVMIMVAFAGFWLQNAIKKIYNWRR